MPALVLGGVTVPVAYSEPVRETPEEAGDRATALDNTPLATVRAYASTLAVTTAPMLRAAADTLLAQIRTIPNTCSGDIPGASLGCHPKLTERRIMPHGRVVTVFELRLL